MNDVRYGHGPHDPLQSSGSLDYLLEDEEEPKRNGFKIVLLVAAFAAVIGFGYVRWKQGDLPWLGSSAKNPPAQIPDASSSGNAGSGDVGSGKAGSPTATPPASPASTNPAPAPAQTTAAKNDSSPASGTTPSAAPQTESTPSSASTQIEKTPEDNSPSPGADSSPSGTTPPTSTNKSGSRAEASRDAQKDEQQDTEQDAQSGSDTDEEPAAKPQLRKANAKPSAAKPAAARSIPAKPVDSVTEAERYIYGRGVRQDCDEGLRILKPAAAQSNPGAMISLGALYSTGTCTPRDLPTAYRWFALALHKQPDNLSLQNDLQKLWAQMTPPERQLAIKLSQ